MITDKKVSAYDGLTEPEGRDLLLIIDVPVSNSASKVTKNINLDTLFGNIPSNVNISQDINVSGNSKFEKLILEIKPTPQNANDNNYLVGQFWTDGDYLYYKANTTIKKIQWGSF